MIAVVLAGVAGITWGWCSSTPEAAEPRLKNDIEVYSDGRKQIHNPAAAARFEGDWKYESDGRRLDLRVRDGYGVFETHDPDETFDVRMFDSNGSFTRAALHSRRGDIAFHWTVRVGPRDRLTVTRVTEWQDPFARYGGPVPLEFIRE
ncbi:MAG: hypothetical protein ACYTGZ_14430 [Planctomycetota bacterium]